MTAIALSPARFVAGLSRRGLVAILLAAGAAALYLLFRGQDTLPHDNEAPLFDTLLDVRRWVDANRNSNPIFVLVVGGIRSFVALTYQVSHDVLHGFGWPGLTVLGGALGYLAGGRLMAALMVSGFLSFGVLGLWSSSVDTLAITLAAVLLSLAIGIPLGILAARNERFMRLISPVLDFMQIMPTFAYLAPLTLFFLIGPATAAIATLIYSVPVAIRITTLGIRGVAKSSVEAASSLGATPMQTLRRVEVPMAAKALVLAVNQTLMMALAMVVITAFVDGPGLGKDILGALQTSDVGEGFDAGLAIVIMAIMFDRLTTRAALRLDPASARARSARGRIDRRVVAILAGAVILAVLVGTFVIDGGAFPRELRFSFRNPVNAIVDWAEFNLYDYTQVIKDVATYGFINPLQTLLTSAPWWLAGGAITAIAALVGGLRAAITAAICLLLIVGLQMWEHTMQTLVTVLLGTVLTLALGVVLGILSARSDRFSIMLRPLLDAAQTMPAFIYLLPAVALFGPTRFMAVFAAVIYAVPPVIRLVEAGIRTVPPVTIEAAMSAGVTERQLLWKVQLPMSKPALLLAANQGIVLVLAMVVVGGFVGAGALGYDVVAGFARRDFFGEGLAAALAIVLLGILLDRITQGAGRSKARPLERPIIRPSAI